MDIINTLLGVVANISAVVTVVISLAIYFRVKSQQKKLQIKAAEGTKPLILNFSGHPLVAFEADWGKGIEQVQVPTTIPVNDGQSKVESYFVSLLTTLAPEVYARILAGDSRVVVVPPGMCTHEFVAVFHAISGQFPVTTRSQRTADGKFVWLTPRDLQALRLETRAQVRG